MGFDNRAFVLTGTDMNSLLGDYENIEYAKDRMNDWHYATITLVDSENGVYRWKNRAGAWWHLTKKPDDPTKLTVDHRCPYYPHGYKEASLKFDDNGNVIQIAGPFGERYNKQSPDDEAA